jgi:hypothetical protein
LIAEDGGCAGIEATFSVLGVLVVVFEVLFVSGEVGLEASSSIEEEGGFDSCGSLIFIGFKIK